jgi:proline racemase
VTWSMGPIRTIDYHTAGEPFRIVAEGGPAPAGRTVLDRRATAQRSREIDAVRQLLVREPRGHADMYGCFVVPPDDAGAKFGALFWHKDGYSTACGHGTIALGVWAVESGLVEAAPDGVTNVVIDVASGRVTARVQCSGGLVTAVTFRNVDSYVLHRRIEVATTHGTAHVDVSFGGAIYASVSADSLGLAVVPDRFTELVAVGREIKAALDGTAAARHPNEERLDGIYGTIFYDDLGDTPDGPHQRNVTVFADGELDRSPCGSGTSARLALLAADDRIVAGQTLVHDSIIGTTFRGRVRAVRRARGVDLVTTEVEGSAYRTGECSFVLDARDNLGTGFTLR